MTATFNKAGGENTSRCVTTNNIDIPAGTKNGSLQIGLKLGGDVTTLF